MLLVLISFSANQSTTSVISIMDNILWSPMLSSSLQSYFIRCIANSTASSMLMNQRVCLPSIHIQNSVAVMGCMIRTLFARNSLLAHSPQYYSLMTKVCTSYLKHVLVELRVVLHHCRTLLHNMDILSAFVLPVCQLAIVLERVFITQLICTSSR